MISLYDLLSREYNGSTMGFNRVADRMMSGMMDNFTLLQDIPSRTLTINSLDVDVSKSFVLTGSSNGSVGIYSVNDAQVLSRVKEVSSFTTSFIARIQWFPRDNEMFAVSTNGSVCFVDSNALEAVETQSFESNHVFDTDWNVNKSSLLAVACSSSTVRFIDIRSGSSLSSLVISSSSKAKDHSASRVLWDKRDEDCLFVGDTLGFIHIFDIRQQRKPVQRLHPEDDIDDCVLGLDLTPDGMTLISSHGSLNKLYSWSLKNRVFQSNNVHFDPLVCRKGTKKSFPISPLTRSRFFVTENYVVTPIGAGRGDASIHDLTTGQHMTTLTTSEVTNKSNSFRRINCVTGLYSKQYSPVFFVGGKKLFHSYAVSSSSKEEERIPVDQESSENIPPLHFGDSYQQTFDFLNIAMSEKKRPAKVKQVD